MRKPLKTRLLAFNQEAKADVSGLLRGPQSPVADVVDCTAADEALIKAARSLWIVSELFAQKLVLKGETVVSTGIGLLWCRTLPSNNPWDDDVFDIIVDESLGPGRDLENVIERGRVIRP